MPWWERKHILVREKARLDTDYPENNFQFSIRGDALWLTGTLLNFFEFELEYPHSYPFAPPDIFPVDRTTKWVPGHQYVKDGRFCLDIREKAWNSSLSASDIVRSLEILLIAQEVKKAVNLEKLPVYEEDEPTKLQRRFKQIRCIVPAGLEFPKGQTLGFTKVLRLFKTDAFRVVVAGIFNDDKEVGPDWIRKVWPTESILSGRKGLWLAVPLETVIDILYTNKYDRLNELLVEKGFIAEGTKLHVMVENEYYVRMLLFDPQYRS